MPDLRIPIPQGQKASFSSQRGKFSQVPTFTGQQQDVQNQILQQLLQANPQIFEYLTQLLQGSPESTAAFEEPYLRQFKRQIVPGLAEQFGASAGSHGSLSSSGLNQSLSQGATDLQTNLASLREGLRGQAINQLQSFLNPGFQSSFQNIYHPPTEGFFNKFLGSFAGGAGQGLGRSLFGGFGG